MFFFETDHSHNHHNHHNHSQTGGTGGMHTGGTGGTGGNSNVSINGLYSPSTRSSSSSRYAPSMDSLRADAQAGADTHRERNMRKEGDTVWGRALVALRRLCSSLRHTAHSALHVFLGQHGEEVEVEEDVACMQEDLSSIFLWGNPSLYFFTVEFALLTQCLWIAMWATNFIFIAMDSYFPVLWQLALVLPLPINFWLLSATLFQACTLKAVVSLDRTVADKICEDALDERNVTERLRKVIRSTLSGLSFEKDLWPSFLREQFAVFKKEGAKGISEKELRLFLRSLQIFLTDISVSRIFRVIDFDRDGRVSWEDLQAIVFPELVEMAIQVQYMSYSNIPHTIRRTTTPLYICICIWRTPIKPTLYVTNTYTLFKTTPLYVTNTTLFKPSLPSLPSLPL
jgi:hypothetical protein